MRPLAANKRATDSDCLGIVVQFPLYRIFFIPNWLNIDSTNTDLSTADKKKMKDTTQHDRTDKRALESGFRGITIHS